MLRDAASSVRFQEWFQDHRDLLTNISNEVCNKTLATYLENFRDSKSKTCLLHVDCILSNLTESVKANLASSSVMLSVAPGLLSMIGPSITQLTLLSARRPFLSLLIAVGSTGFYLDRLFRVETPVEVLSMVPGEHLIPRLKNMRWGVLVSIAEYALVFAAVANVLHNSFTLGKRTILSFQCAIFFLPLVWTLSLAFLFLLVAIPFQFSDVAKHLRNCELYKHEHALSAPESQANGQWDTPLPPPPPISSVQRTNSSGSISKFIALEFTPNMRRPTVEAHRIPQFEHWIAVVLNIGIFLCSFHVLFGVVVLSSTLFLSITDALFVVGRYFLSASVCRVVVMTELASMKSAEVVELEKEK